MIKKIRVFDKDSAIADMIFEIAPENIAVSGESGDFAAVMPGFCGVIADEFELLLVPRKFAGRFQKGDVITYGMEADSMITLSSVGEERCVMTVQREINDIWGGVIEPQDIMISRMHLEPEEALAASAAMFIMCAKILL